MRAAVRTLLLGSLVSGSLILACAQPATAPATPARSSSAPSDGANASAGGSPNQPVGSAQQAATTREVAEALQLVASVRRLEPRREVPGVRLTRSELLKEMSRMLAQESPPQLMLGTREVLFAADTIAPGFDLEQGIVKMYTSELAGFYDPKVKRMVLISDLSGDAQNITLYHELVHALQDQHFDLTRAFDWQPDMSDQQSALHALAEGDATAAMVEVFAAARGQPAQRLPAELLAAQSLIGQADPALAELPGVMLRSMLAPYADGLAFVQALRSAGEDWSKVDNAFREPPQSTEQLLHPLKYLAREAPHLPPVPAAPPGFEELYRDVMGEQGTRLIFEDWAPNKQAAEAASDWDGDRVVVYRRGNQYAVHWHLVFDNEAAASRALVTLARGAARPELAPDVDARTAAVRPFADAAAAAANARNLSLCQLRGQRGPFAATRHGRHVGVVFGPYERTGTGVRAAGTCPDALSTAHAIARTQ
ncbi:MAG TPA: DUF6782 family putative metallopeptidase [Polyangiaceae bacterium]|nr:DUF6782 family putative metallopeptidase [Polyangiaceae bacterium]